MPVSRSRGRYNFADSDSDSCRNYRLRPTPTPTPTRQPCRRVLSWCLGMDRRALYWAEERCCGAGAKRSSSVAPQRLRCSGTRRTARSSGPAGRTGPSRQDPLIPALLSLVPSAAAAGLSPASAARSDCHLSGFPFWSSLVCLLECYIEGDIWPKRSQKILLVQFFFGPDIPKILIFGRNAARKYCLFSSFLDQIYLKCVFQKQARHD